MNSVVHVLVLIISTDESSTSRSSIRGWSWTSSAMEAFAKITVSLQLLWGSYMVSISKNRGILKTEIKYYVIKILRTMVL